MFDMGFIDFDTVLQSRFCEIDDAAQVVGIKLKSDFDKLMEKMA